MKGLRIREAAIIVVVFIVLSVSALSINGKKVIARPVFGNYPSASTEDNKTKKGFAVYSGGYIYYCDSLQNDKIYRIKPDGTGKTKLSNDSALSLFIKGEYIYYSNLSDGNKIYRIKLDGSGRKAITSDGANYINFDDDVIYYSNITKENKLYSVNIDGKGNKRINDESASFINFTGDYVLYRNGSAKLIKMRKNGTERKVIINDSISHVEVAGDEVYYTLQNDSNKLFSMKLDGTSEEKVCNASSFENLYEGKYVYFLNLGVQDVNFLSNHIYRVDTLDNSISEVPGGYADEFCISGETLFYRAVAEGGRIYSVNLDGTHWRPLEGTAKVYSVDEILLALKEKVDFDIEDDKLSRAYFMAQDIIKSIIKPDMTDLQKELAIHDYLVKNTSYDYAVTDAFNNNQVVHLDSHSVYSVLVDGKGVCDGFSYASELLLGMCGIESSIVTGSAKSDADKKDGTNRLYHAWNKVKIGGEYYNYDVTWDINIHDQTGAMCYRYFNVSDTLLANDHNWVRKYYLKANSKKYDFYGESFFAGRDGDELYYSNEIDGSKLYKINIDGTGKMKINSSRSLFVIVDKGWIYYSDYSSGGSMHKMSLDGKEDLVLSDDWCTNLKLRGDYIEYVNSKDKNRYRIKTDGTGKEKI